MHESKYAQLREQLRQKAAKETANHVALSKFIFAVADKISQEHGLDKRTCDAGTMRNGKFVPNEFDAGGQNAQFALQVTFHYPNGDLLFQRAVEFTAHIVEDVVHIELIDGTKAIQLIDTELTNKDSQLALSSIVDEEIEAAVSAALGIPPEF